jgi:hypothetical protein
MKTKSISFASGSRALFAYEQAAALLRHLRMDSTLASLRSHILTVPVWFPFSHN